MPMRALRAVASAVVCVTFLAGCGTRVSHSDVVASASTDVVSLTPETIKQLTQARAPAPAVEAGTAAAPVGVAAAASVPAAAPVAAARSAGGAKPAAAAALAAPASAPTAGVPAKAGAACVASGAPVPIGQVGTFGGVAGPLTGVARTMLAAWAQDVNSRGGLACHPVQVYSADDGGDPSRAAALANQMVAEHHVAAFVGVVTLGMSGFKPAVEALKVPALGGGGSEEEYSSPWFFPDGSSIDDQGLGLIREGSDFGHHRIGYLYCVEISACGDFDKRLHGGLAAQGGGQVVYDSPISITQPDYTAQCLNARDAKVDFLLLGMDGASIARVGRSCAAIGYKPLLGTQGALLGPAQAADTLLRSFGIATVTAEAPWFLDDTPGLTAFHRAFSAYAPNAALLGAATMAWTSAKMLESVIDHVAGQARGGPITPQLIVEGLGAVHDESLGGLTAKLTFHAGEKNGTSSGCIFYELLGTSGWTAPNGSRPVCVRK
jgi:branched-chain amino acid transport system substrate-binding protein